jgi:hypothetical protein
MDVTFSIAICVSLVAIPDGSCNEENAMRVLEKPLHLTGTAEPALACTREAYAYLQSFPRPRDEPLTISWTCSVAGTAHSGGEESRSERKSVLPLSAVAFREDLQLNACSSQANANH